MSEIGVGLLGLGSVGSGVIDLLFENQSKIVSRLGAPLSVTRVCVRDMAKKRTVPLKGVEITDDPMAVIRDPSVKIVCELIGGTKEAKTLVIEALKAGKHVVTANKALLAEHAEEIFGTAKKHGVDVYYEGAVAGGIPIIRTLREGLAADRIESIHGIVNGTSNFILSLMADGQSSFAEALASAQKSGFAEADPSLDIGGGDAAHKLSILVTLAFGVHIPPHKIHREGIQTIGSTDFKFAERFGFAIKPLAIAKEHGKHGIEARVHPTLVPKHWLLASVPDAKNALYVRSFALGSSMYYGAGAGGMPTAMAVISDLIEVARNITSKSEGRLPARSFQDIKSATIYPDENVTSRFYCRLSLRDKPGVLGKITNILGEYSVSIAQLIQEDRTPQETAGEFASVIVLTHATKVLQFKKAMADIENLEDCLTKPVVLRVVQ